MLTREGWEHLDRMFNVSLELTGKPPENALFDPQLAEYLDQDWLIEQAHSEESLSREQVEALLADGLIRTWPSKSNKQGFIPYSTRQAGVFQRLKATGRYSLVELRHIAEQWSDYLEAVVIEEPPYDNRDGDQLEHFRRRVHENIESFSDAKFFYNCEQSTYNDNNEFAYMTISDWQMMADVITGKTQSDLPLSSQRAIQHVLWRMRWVEEFVRLAMAKHFEEQLLQGYGVEVTFYGMNWVGCDPNFGDIDWSTTFRRLRETRASGQTFPLRLPEFNVTERGVELIAPCTPDQYRTVYEKYRFNEMLRIVEEMGKDLWFPSHPPLGGVTCAECKRPFWRDNLTQLYCGEKCRKRAKNRRWRESNPERARQAQAKYWSSYGVEN